MDSGEGGGGGGDGGGGEERDADLSPQALSLPFLTHAVVSEQGSSSHTSAVAPAKEPLTLPQQEEEEATEGSQARGETHGEELGSDHQQKQENKACHKQGKNTDFGEGYLSGRRDVGEAHKGVGKASDPGPPLNTPISGIGVEEKEGEEAISNQSQTKSKCYLLPHQSQQSSSSSTAKASGTLNSKTAASPKPSPFLSTSPKHFNCPSFSSVMLSEGEAKYIIGDQGWISGSPKSFKSQQPTLALPLAETEPSCTPAEDDGTAGVLHSSISNGDGAKAPEPNEGQLDTDMDDDRDKEGDSKEAVLKTFNQELSPNSLTSQMTIMHSRNSCKTLKCPKCNWHYKSQHTLQLHMKEKHPENGGQCVCGVPGGKCVCGSATRGVCGYCSSGKPHPRLARGETYACGYKPYRCEVCDYATSSKGNLSIHMQSDKHLNNVQNGGHSNSQMHTAHLSNNSSSSNGHALDETPYKLPLSSSTPASLPVKPTPPVQSHSHGKRWRCDVCDYETSIARNLRIHTTSEKHTHNMLRLQRGYYLSHCRSLAPQLKHLQNPGAELSLNMRLTGQTVTEQPITLGSTLTPSPSPSPSPPPAPSLSPSEELSHAVFQCLVCSCFSTDSLESIEQHLNTPRSLPQSDWCSLVAGGCHCRLCGYTTPLRANFSLHCQTDRHRTRYQLAAHLQEGGDRGQEGSAMIAKGNPVQLRCNLCDYITSSFEKMRGHSHSSHHEASVRVYRFLQQYDGEVDGGSWLFHCLLCNHSSSSKLQVLKHSQTPTHQQREALLQLQPMDGEELAAIFTIRRSQDGVTELSEDMEVPCKTTTGLLDQTKDKLGARQVSPESDDSIVKEKKCLMKRPLHDDGESENLTKRPRTHQQNENQQTVQCPLCQAKVQYPQLRQHLTHIHSVAQDCVDKLISAVKPPAEKQQHQLDTEQQTDACEDDAQKSESVKTDKENAPNNSLTSHTKGEKTEGDVVASKDVTALLTPPLEENTGHPSNERLAPQSPTQTPPSSPPTSPPSDPPPHSDRHGYRFRCSRCSLAFPTQEKLQLHWQYHAMRAATECPLCSRQCRSQEALQRHIQNTHSQTDAQSQSVPLPSENGQENNKTTVPRDLSSSPEVGQDAGVGDDEGMEEEVVGSERNEEQEEIKERGSTGGNEIAVESLTETEKGLQEDSITELGISSVAKKSANPTMDRYLDPSRPYKCTICSESFTQKTILLVHYNSVSHLHRARRALQESSTGVSAPEAPRGPDPRPYRCKLCGVGYSQSSTLDIHLRSVLHQTRARASQNPAPQTPLSGAGSTNASTTAQKATSSEEGYKNLTVTQRQDAATPSTSSLAGFTNSGENLHDKAKVAELIASRNQLMLLQQQHLAQAQAQAQLQHTALLQSQILQHLPIGTENLLQHLNLAPDNLLALQQQLLLPFYLSGEMKPNSDSAIKSPDLSKLELTKATPPEDVKAKAKSQLHEVDEKQMADQVESANNVPSTKPTEAKSNSSLEDDKDTFDNNKILTENKDSTSGNVHGIQCPPPRVPFAAVNGESLRALLQSYGYELALQYIQNRHRHQQQKSSQEKNEPSVTHNMENNSEEEKEKLKGLLIEQAELFDKDSEQRNCQQDKESQTQKQQSEQDELTHKKKECCANGEKCKECGKFFSDAMILKSHQEYFHRVLFPSAALERFSKEYRLQYDQMYPLANSTNENATASSQPSCATTPSESEPTVEDTKSQVKTNTQIPSSSASDSASPIDKSSAQTPPSSPEPQPSPKQDADSMGPGTSATCQNTSPAKALPLPLPKIPMIPLPMPQLPIPPLPLAKLPLTNLPFPMELPLIPPVVMQSMALQPQPWLDSSVNPELAKLFQSQLNPALLGQQTQMSQAMLHQQPQLSPALLGQSPQLNPALLSQPSQPSLIPSGQQPQVSPSIPEQQGKRTRTRISEEQLAVLRKHFDINSLPSDDEINKMAVESGLPHKVIKHWFRNTLFKERQRDKDSPYNFNNPPTTELEEGRDEAAQSRNLSVSPSSLSPALPTNTLQQAQVTEFQRGDHHRGRRSSRTRFTEKQLETLQGVFEATPYPREEEYDRLSVLLSLPNRVIVVWFQNARQRARKSQDRGADDDLEGRKQFDYTQSKKNGCYKNEDGNVDNSCGDDGHNDSNNENSMDLTYEYYTHAESPAPDSSQCAEGLAPRDEHVPVKKKRESKTSSPMDKTSTETKNGIPAVEEKEQKDLPTVSLPQPVAQVLAENTANKIESHSSKYTPNTVPKAKSVSNASLGLMHSPPADPVVEKPADISPSLPTAVESETNHSWQSGLPSESQLQKQHKPANQTQFQCGLCPMTLTSIQHWQEHQTRHLLAAQSQVQLLHSGFTDRTMPYMMLHPNHTLMASQMLSGAMSQMNPNATHPFISQLNSMQLKNSLPDHSSNNLTSLSQGSMTPMKQCSKVMSEMSFDSQRCAKEAEEEHRRDKRQRTTITPEQLEVLYQRYSLDSNPTRGVLEGIARDVGLTRRVVQVWFQNTRARERKGQFRSMGPGSSFSLGLNHLRCPFCRALFKVKSALDAHMRSRHWADAERAGYNLSMANGLHGQISMAMSSTMERPSPSISCNPNPSYMSNELSVKPPFSSPTDQNNPQEDDDYEEEDEEDFQSEEGTSMGDQGCLSPEGAGGPSPDWGDTQALQQHHQQQQRQRTQMSHFQVLQLRDFYRSHRTPNRHECESLGQKLGLPHRVVQVWFQNARAKEKRARSMSSDTADREQAELTAVAGERDRA
ncbi:zinc finger homeobox protein 3-like isoform X2 [Synchiropus splendidus]|uniref:zinc finger homeobox protein 3-like isoform X2 n=1 Tax=Synchiropus splendidus TaxID=270530 RepID=UPI00237D7AF7|nr:zinc finger homeobox protein 3-like isoform X2 [Synchiropus splendidus]